MARRDPRADLLCPCCGKRRAPDETALLRAEAEWRATGAFDARRPPGWSVEAARSGGLRWACTHCLRVGRALEGRPALQRWCDFDPYFAFLDDERRCEDCGRAYVFSAAEQRYWYETLRFWVQSRPKRCAPCRRSRREARDAGEHRGGAGA